MTEFEEIALKKITKDYLVASVYSKINVLADKYGITNSDISKKIGWDPAGFNQKYNRSNDLRITTFIKIYVALTELISQNEKEAGWNPSSIGVSELITVEEIEVARLFNHISAVAEGEDEFLSNASHSTAYTKMRPFVLMGKKNQRYNEREVNVYVKYYGLIQDGNREQNIE